MSANFTKLFFLKNRIMRHLIWPSMGSKWIGSKPEVNRKWTGSESEVGRKWNARDLQVHDLDYLTKIKKITLNFFNFRTSFWSMEWALTSVMTLLDWLWPVRITRPRSETFSTLFSIIMDRRSINDCCFILVRNLQAVSVCVHFDTLRIPKWQSGSMQPKN